MEATAKKTETVIKKAFNKEIKKIKAKEIFWKKLEDKVSNNVKTVLEKVQSIKQKMALFFNNLNSKKKQ